MIRIIAILCCLILCLTEIFGQFVILKELLEYADSNITRVRTQEEREALSNEFAVLDFIGLVEQYDGYTAEEYDVQTEDGYILKLHRISGSPLSPKHVGKPVIYLQHGLFGSSDFQVALGPEHALTFLLADAGYDVWMGNVRGNAYSKRHINYTADRDSEFWNFSMDEMAVIDVPKFIDVVLEKTNQKKLTFIGYSMGTTLSYILLSEKPEYNDKMKLVVSIAPVAYFTLPFKLPVLAILAVAPVLRAFAAINQIDEILPQSKIVRVLGKEICTSELGKIFCGSFLTTIVSPEKFNFTALPEILAYTPAGTSRNTVLHYYQMIKTKEFKKFDFGRSTNIAKYGSASPPSYDLSKITSPQAIFYSESDLYVSVKDATTLKKKLKNVVAFETAPYGYNHLDYMWATDAYEKLYFTILKVVESNP